MRGLPAVVKRLQEAVARALREPAVRDKLSAQGLFATGSTPEEFAVQKKEIDKMQRIANFAKITLD